MITNLVIVIFKKNIPFSLKILGGEGYDLG
jgi:hypothetical protein